MSPRTLMLLPPSEGKSDGGGGSTWAPATMAIDLDGQRSQLQDALQTLDGEHPDPSGPTRPAIERYSGVLYDELDAVTMSEAARQRLNDRVRIVSGRWGLVAPNDPIPFYKLKMSASVPPLGRLSTWWRPAITEVLTDLASDAIVWDLLPNEHAAAIDWRSVPVRHRVTIRFLDRNGRTVSHWNKLLKGSIVRWLVESGETDPAALATFRHPRGYRLDADATVVDGDHTAFIMREMEAGS